MATDTARPDSGVSVPGQKPGPTQYYAAGEKFYSAFRYEQALKYYLQAIKLDKTYLDAWKKVSFCYYKLNNHRMAYAAFKKVLQLDPNDKEALDFMNYYSSITEKNRKKNEKREPFDSIWRSAVLPGWGQFHNNQHIKGIMAAAGVIIGGGLTAYSVIEQHQKYDKYLTINENQDLAYRDAEAAWNTALIWTIVTAVFYAGGIIDAAINYDCIEARVAFNSGVVGDGPAVMACIRW